ncbi:hypothetical protein EG832_16825 [bacterium]|nr:hypothetical protein [bacterium]
MKKILFPMIVGGIGLFFLAWAVMVKQPTVEASLRQITTDKSLIVDESLARPNATSLNTNEVRPSAKIPQNAYPVSIDPIEFANILSNQVVKARESANSFKPGWLLQRSSKRSELIGDNGDLPNGTVIPEEYDMETWLNIDKQGTIIQSVAIMTGLDGQIIQVGIQNQDKGWNTATLSQTDASPQPFMMRWENPLKELLAQLETEAVTMQRDARETKKIIICSVLTFFPQPLKINGTEKEIISSETQYLINEGSGQIMQIDVLSTNVDGEKNKIQSFYYLPFEAIEIPNPEILEYLELAK